MPTQSWSIQRRAWLGQQSFAETTQQAAFDDYVTAVVLVDRRTELLERHLADAANDGPHAQFVARLRCLRGVDTLTAIGIVRGDRRLRALPVGGPLHELRRARPVGALERRAAQARVITRAGNDHVRRLLVEAAWNHRRQPGASYTIQRRRRGQHPLAVERAIRAERRLYRRWSRMRSRGKDERTITVAVARELAGFVWAVATDPPLIPTA